MPLKPADWQTWYWTAGWRRRAKLQLRFQPLCEMCLKEQKLTPAKIADHIEPHKGDWNSFRLGKLQSLCPTCHSSTKYRIERYGFDPAIKPDGYPADPKHPAYKAR